MKVFFKKILQMNDDYQEILIDENSFDKTNYLDVRPQTRNILGLTYDDIYIIEPESYYQVILKSNTPYEFEKFIPNIVWCKAGLIISNIHREANSIFIYNPTKNHIYLRSNAIIGELL